MGPMRRAIKFEVAEITDAYRAVETLSDNIHEAITVTHVHMKERMFPRQLREHRPQMRGAEG